jgi:DNA-binding response OmpR family regulator
MDLVVLGDVEVDLVARRAGHVRLTSLEAKVLRYLLEHPDTDIPREQLLSEVWGYAPQARSRAVDLVMSRLRQKLGEELRERLLTSHGVGYRLVMGQAARQDPAPGRAPVRIPGGQLDLDQRRFVPDQGEPVGLTPQEATVVELLLATRGVVEREQIERALWRHASEHVLQGLLQRLKRKLGEALVVRRGLGVQLLRVEHRTNLPPSPDRFFARSELADAHQALQRHRGVVLRGPAGVGKSRLALELGHQLLVEQPELEVWWVPLSGALGTGSFLHGVARALQIELGAEPVEQLGRVLAARPKGVLILDNLEQLLEQVPILQAWLRGAPRMRFVLTSRCSLPMEAHEITLRPLPLDTALALFHARAAPWEKPDPAQVRHVVERLDGLPLAIELAAARVEQLDKLAHSLDERLDLLGQGRSTLRGAIDWSWALLAEPEREALMDLALFRGPIPRALAAQVETLCAHCLVQELPDGFVLADTIRLYAREKLAQSPDRDTRVLRWAERLLAHTDAMNEQVGYEPGHLSAVRSLRALRDDVWDLVTQAPTPYLRSKASEALYLLTFIDGRTSNLLERWREYAELTPGWWGEGLIAELLLDRRETEEARPHVARALELADEIQRVSALRIASTLSRQLGLHDRALLELQEARAIARKHAGRPEEITCCIDLTTLMREQGELASGLAMSQEAEELAREVGSLHLLAGALEKRARLLLWFEEWDMALAAACEATELLGRLDFQFELAQLWCVQALVRRGRGEYELAEQLFEQAEALLHQLGCTEPQILWNRALLALEQGDEVLASELFERAVAQNPSQSEIYTGYARYHAVVWLLAGEPAQAIAKLSAVEEPFLARSPRQLHASFLGFFAVAHAMAGQLPQASEYLARARLAVSPLPSAEAFLRLVEAMLTDPPQAMEELLRHIPRGDGSLEILRRVCERAIRRAPARPGSPGTGARP